MAASHRGRVTGEVAMLMSVVEGLRSNHFYPEIAGKRVLITGMTAAMGVDIARAFAEAKARLVLQFDESSEEMQAVAEVLAPMAVDLAVYGGVRPEADDVVRFARTAVTRFGGIDADVNIIPLAGVRHGHALTANDVEKQVADRLVLPCLVSRIVANRMRLTLTDGVILNIATLPGRPSGTERAFGMVAKSALATMTRKEAIEWGREGIRFNAVAPQCGGISTEPGLAGEADIAALALYLTSGRGKALSGHMFDAELA